MKALCALCIVWLSYNVAINTRETDCEDEQRPQIETTEDAATDDALPRYCDLFPKRLVCAEVKQEDDDAANR